MLLQLPSPLRKALLLSILGHAALFMLLQLILVVQRGAPPPPHDITLARLSVRLLPSGPAKGRPQAQAAVAAPLPAPPAADTRLAPPEEAVPEPSLLPTIEFFEPPAYHPISELSQRPNVVQDIPLDAGDVLPSQLEGTVIMRLLINESGTVDDAVIEETDIAVRDLLPMQTLFRGMVFTPGMKDGLAVKSELRIEVKVTPPPIVKKPQKPLKR